MMKLVSICASANDLFGLDGDGVVYQYNFNTKTWMPLDRGRSDRRELSLDEGPSASGEAKPRSAAQLERERML